MSLSPPRQSLQPPSWKTWTRARTHTHLPQDLSALKFILACVEQDLAELHWLITAWWRGEAGQLVCQLQAQVCVHGTVRGLLHSILKHQGDGVAQHVCSGDDLQQLLQEALKLLGRQLVQNTLDSTQGLRV
eukprot:scaffold136011_cov22-Tisochrysis_lutea.AAC.2